MGASVFISYQRADIEHARHLAERLGEYGCTVWWDSAIQPGQDWRETIVEGLEDASVFVVLHSVAAEKSAEVRKEIAAASALGKTMIAVRLEDRKPSGVFLYEMAALNWVEAFADPTARLDALAQRLAATDLANTSRLGIASAVDARPIRRSAFSRLTGSNAVLGGLLGGALLLAIFCMNAMGEGLAAMRTETGIALVDIVYVVGAVLIGAPLLILRFLLSPPASPAAAGLLLAAILLLFCYTFLIRNGLRALGRGLARRTGGERK